MDTVMLHETIQDLVFLLGKNQVLYGQIPLEYSRDFGNLHQQAPFCVAIATSTDQLQIIIRKLSAKNIVYSIRGAGHSSSGHTISRDGFIVHIKAFGGECISLIDNKTAVLFAGTLWSDVKQQLNQRGLTFPIFTSHLATSVGGTLSAGGYGIQSCRYGGQIDHVLSVTCVLPDGSLKVYQKKDPAYRQVLTGMGRVYPIALVEVRILPYHPWMKVFNYRFQNNTPLGSVAEFLDELNEVQCSLFKIEYIDREVLLSIGYEYTDMWEAILCGLSPLKTLSPDKVSVSHESDLYDYVPYSFTSYRHLWLDYGISAAYMKELLLFLQDTVVPRSVGILGRIYIIRISGNDSGISFINDLREPFSDEITYGVGIYFNIAYGVSVDEANELGNVISDYIGKIGGRVYGKNTAGESFPDCNTN